MSKKKSIGWWIPLFLSTVVVFLFVSVIKTIIDNSNNHDVPETVNVETTPTTTVSVSPSQIPTPTPKPLTFVQMNALYGPCTNTPVLIYHHIQSKDDATKRKQVSLSTYTDIFEEQLKYLQSKGYQTIDIANLAAFFNGNSTIPAKSVILTFDDGYSDFYSDAYPLLQKYNYKAVVFLPTGLVENTDYLTWNEITAMNNSGAVYFGNHTWSHYATTKDEEKTVTEIKTADTQLSEKGLNLLKVFAYPYGSSTSFSINYLKSINYNLAFTTQYGKILCAKNNLVLPRLRMGNLMPPYYGL